MTSLTFYGGACEIGGNKILLEDKGVKVFMNPESVQFMKGSTVDYVDALTNAGFKINNPNVKTSCGCGHSVG